MTIKQRIIDLIETGRMLLTHKEARLSLPFYEWRNDGTDFDWECNNRTCEIMVYYQLGDKPSDNDMGAIKIMINRDDTATIYAYNRAFVEPNFYCFDKEQDKVITLAYHGAYTTKQWLKKNYELQRKTEMGDIYE